MMEVGLNRGSMGNRYVPWVMVCMWGSTSMAPNANIIFAQPWFTPEDLNSTPVMTPSGEVVQLGELVGIAEP